MLDSRLLVSYHLDLCFVLWKGHAGTRIPPRIIHIVRIRSPSIPYFPCAFSTPFADFFSLSLSLFFFLYCLLGCYPSIRKIYTVHAEADFCRRFPPRCIQTVTSISHLPRMDGPLWFRSPKNSASCEQRPKRGPCSLFVEKSRLFLMTSLCIKSCICSGRLLRNTRLLWTLAWGDISFLPFSNKCLVQKSKANAC